MQETKIDDVDSNIELATESAILALKDKITYSIANILQAFNNILFTFV